MNSEIKCKDCTYCQSLGTTKVQCQGTKYPKGVSHILTIYNCKDKIKES